MVFPQLKAKAKANFISANFSANKMATMQKTECDVCCDSFNKSTRIRIPCEHSGACSFEACKTCVRTYLLGTTSDPNCMSCNKGWSDKFLTTYMKASFVRSEYKAHRKELLVQTQISRIPESMAAAETYKRVYDINIQIDRLKITSDQIKAEEKKWKELYMSSESKMTYETYRKKSGDLYTSASVIRSNIRKMRHDIAVIQNGGQAVTEEVKEKKKFIMPCPNTDCRGFLSSEYTCEMCNHKTCPKCLDLVGLINQETEHVCKPENVESAEFVRKQSKPCPCCGSRISKIDGCDQMWCTQCHKAFSWNTGRIVTGVVHNPHFYQYQREMGGGVAPRNPGDVVCGGLIGVQELLHKLHHNRVPANLTDKLATIHREVQHFNGVVVNHLRRTIQVEQDYNVERMKYIVKEISREKLADIIIKKDVSRKRESEKLHIGELFVTVATDLFAGIIRNERKSVEFIQEIERGIVEFNNLREYCNDHFKTISITYGICVPYINAEWKDDTSKFNSKGDVDKYIERREKAREETKQKWVAQREAIHEEWKERMSMVRLDNGE